MGLPFRSPGQRPLHRIPEHEVGARQQRLVQVGQHPCRPVPRRVVLEPGPGQPAPMSSGELSDGDGVFRQGVDSLRFLSWPHSGSFGQSTILTVVRLSPNTNRFPPSWTQGMFGSPGLASLRCVSLPSSLNQQEIRRLYTRQRRLLISPATAPAHVSASSIVVISEGTARLL